MKRNQKQVLEIYKTTRVTVLSFENGVRYSTYASIDVITALCEVSKHTKEGRNVLIFESEDKSWMTWELKNKGRVPYEVVLPYAINLSLS